jgi:hypothetical protein
MMLVIKKSEEKTVFEEITLGWGTRTSTKKAAFLFLSVLQGVVCVCVYVCGGGAMCACVCAPHFLCNVHKNRRCVGLYIKGKA